VSLSRFSPDSRKFLALALAIPLAVAVTACGGNGADGGRAAAAVDVASFDAAPVPQEMIDAATREGKVVLYSSQTQANIDAFVRGFTRRYPGITVEALRVTDQDAPAKIEAEKSHGIADMYVGASLPAVERFATNGYFAQPTGPEFSSADYKSGAFLKPGNYFEVGSVLLLPVWNTDLVPSGIKSYQDLLDPKLAGGKIGVPAVVAASSLDMYLYLEDTLGSDYLTRLAAQKPRLYATTTAAGQAVVSGEIAVAAFAPPPMADKAKGAPVDYLVPDKVWGARYYGSVLASAPHPAAAQLLANYMITREGQQLVGNAGASVYANVPDTLAPIADVRQQDSSRLAAQAVSTFSERWTAMVNR
jgi:iron(III) transport system substrate-binding protein